MLRVLTMHQKSRSKVLALIGPQNISFWCPTTGNQYNAVRDSHGSSKPVCTARSSQAPTSFSVRYREMFHKVVIRQWTLTQLQVLSSLLFLYIHMTLLKMRLDAWRVRTFKKITELWWVSKAEAGNVQQKVMAHEYELSRRLLYALQFSSQRLFFVSVQARPKLINTGGKLSS